MKKTRKILSVLLIAVLLCSMLAGCGGGEDKVYKIGINQYVQHDALDAATQGFMDKLTELMGEGNVEFDVKNASDDPAVASTIATQFVSDQVDLIMANATPSLQASMAATGDIPIVATSITDFGSALQIEEWTGVTGTNVTGSADLAPLDEQAAMIKELIPDVQKVGILYCSSESNSKYQAEVIEAELDAMEIEWKEYTVADTNDIASVVTQACQDVDCIYIPTDNKIASSTSAVNQIAEAEGVPVVAGEEGICKGCGVATLSISYYSIGEAAAEMAYEILVNGADPAEMEIKYATDLTKKYVADRCDALEIEVPEGYEEIVME